MPDIFLKIFAFAFMVVFFGLCVMVHEFGHFIAARWRGLHVIAFSIGFKKIWWRKIGGVEYRIGCIPFGGYVELPQIDCTNDEPKDENGKTLPRAKPMDRILTAFAGPLFNILFGLLLGVIIWFFGMPQDTPKMRSVEVASVEAGSPEYNAGLRSGDVIFKVNGEAFYDTWNEIVRRILFNISDCSLSVKRGDKDMLISYHPKVNNSVLREEGIAYPFFKPNIPLTVYVESESEAKASGLKSDDRIIKVNGKEVADFHDFLDALDDVSGSDSTLSVMRDGRELLLKPHLKLIETYYRIGAIFVKADEGIKIEESIDGSPASKAGLMKNDRIISLNGRSVSIDNFSAMVKETKGSPFMIELVRDGKRHGMTLSAEKRSIYEIPGISFVFINHPNPLQQFSDVMVLSYKSLRGVLVTLGNRMGLTESYSSLKPSNFSGPVGIGRFIYKSVYSGSLMHGIFVVIIITFNLAILNLLPIPVLDGGHIAMALFEMLFRRPAPARLLQPVTVVFVVLIVSFMLYVTFHDIRKMFPINSDADGAKKPVAASAVKTEPETAKASP